MDLVKVPRAAPTAALWLPKGRPQMDALEYELRSRIERLEKKVDRLADIIDIFRSLSSIQDWDMPEDSE